MSGVAGGPIDESSRVRIDKQSPAAYRAQIAVARTVLKTAQEAGLDRGLVELINIRVSQINGCAACLDVHVRDALAAGESNQRIAVLPAWRDTTLFTDGERAALALAESIAIMPGSRVQEQDYAEARRYLSAGEFSAVAWVAITMSAFNRISIVSGHTVQVSAHGVPAERSEAAEKDVG